MFQSAIALIFTVFLVFLFNRKLYNVSSIFEGYMKPYMNKKDVARLLSCSSILEGKVAAAYKQLSGRVKDPLVESLLLSISYDSLKHSILLKGISKIIVDLRVGEGDCEMVMGGVWKKLIAFSEEEELMGAKIRDEELSSIVDKMMRFESLCGEEYLTRLDLQVLKLVVKDLEVDSESLKYILDGIIEDKKRHEKTMLLVKKMISKR